MSSTPKYMPIKFKSLPNSLPTPAPNENTGPKIPFGTGQLCDSIMKKNFKKQYTKRFIVVSGSAHKAPPLDKCENEYGVTFGFGKILLGEEHVTDDFLSEMKLLDWETKQRNE